MSYADLPPDASMLYGLEIPPSGGNTAFPRDAGRLGGIAGGDEGTHRGTPH